MVELLSHRPEQGCEAMKTYSIPMFLPTSSCVSRLRHQSQLRRRQDLKLRPQHLQSGAQSTELPHLPTELPHLPTELPHLPTELPYLPSELPHLPTVSTLSWVQKRPSLSNVKWLEWAKMRIFCFNFWINRKFYRERYWQRMYVYLDIFSTSNIMMADVTVCMGYAYSTRPRNWMVMCGRHLTKPLHRQKF
jgi:hypothetical protein